MSSSTSITTSWVSVSSTVSPSDCCWSFAVGCGAVTTGKDVDAVGLVDSVAGWIDCGEVCVSLVESVARGVDDGLVGEAWAAGATIGTAAGVSCFGGTPSGAMS